MTVDSVSSRVSTDGGSPAVSIASPMSSTRWRVEQVPGRQVHRHVQVVARVAPRPALRERVAHDVDRELADHAGVLGRRDELVGRQEPEARVVPAHERLGADHHAVAERELRLHVDVDLVGVERLLQVGGQRQSAGGVGVGLGGVDLDAGALLAGPVGGGVGSLEEELGGGGVVRVERDADVGAQHQRHVAGGERRLELGQHDLGEPEHRCRGRSRRVTSTANWSPVNRASCARSGSSASMRSRTSSRSRSPVAMPSVSLTSLKVTRSTNTQRHAELARPGRPRWPSRGAPGASCGSAGR